MSAAHADRPAPRPDERSALIVVDVQNGFCTGGQLAVPDGEAVVPVINAIAPAFANLVHTQLGRMGLPAVAAPQLRVVASCYRVGGGDAGAGEWACTVVWSGPRGDTLRRATFSSSACS